MDCQVSSVTTEACLTSCLILGSNEWEKTVPKSCLLTSTHALSSVPSSASHINNCNFSKKIVHMIIQLYVMASFKINMTYIANKKYFIGVP